MAGSSSGITELLAELREGKEEAAGELFEQVHARLRRLARGQRKRWQGDLSLQTTALAHEAYLKLVGPEARSWKSRSHFFAVAARAMRYILIARARRKAADKRGGDAPLLSLEDLRESLGREVAAGREPADRTVTTEEAAELLVMLDEALERFAEEHPRAAQGVECRFFGGMTIEETAEALGVSASTVSRDWTLARGWLYREMKRLRGGSEALGKESLGDEAAF
ncbi:MAG: ECF-type sigma factor [Salinivenus sp.]